MDRRFLLCCAWLAAANLAQAQTVPTPAGSTPAPTGSAAGPGPSVSATFGYWQAANDQGGSPPVDGTQTPSPLAEACGIPLCCQNVCGPPGQIWVRAEYLLWWTKSLPVPPLLTTSPQGTPANVAGLLGQPGTEVLFGDKGYLTDPRSGGRIWLGAWLNQEQTFGIEADYFGLQNLSTTYNAASSGNPILVRPFFNTDTGRPDNLFVAFPGLVAGSFSGTVSSTDLYGYEVLLRQNLCCGCCYRVDLLGGYRFLNLNEGVGIAETETFTGPNIGAPVRFDLTDNYNTRNAFNGGELGLEAEFRHCQWYVDAYGKVALGGNAAQVNVSGNTVETVGPITAAFNRGFLTSSPSQTGTFNRSTFAVVPEVGLRIGCQVNDHLRAFVAYTFIYWSDVARPGEQIGQNVSLTHLPPLPAGPSQLLDIRTSDFWAQGVSFGLEFRY
jgi:Putative beta barrel porin-7 (BBP7)